MDRSQITFRAEDGALLVAFDPPLSAAEYAELGEVLAAPITREEILAVVRGLAEDWYRTVTAVSAPWEWN